MQKVSRQQVFDGLIQARTFGLCVLAATLAMPFTRAINGAAIIFTASFSLFLGLMAWAYKLPRQPAYYKLSYLSVALFFLYIAGLFWVSVPGFTPNADIRLGMIAFPAMVYFFPFSDKERDLAYFWFTISVTVLGLVTELAALRLYQLNGNTYYFVGESLIVPFRLHRVYLSSHILLGLVLLTLKGRTWAPPAWRVIWQIFLGTMVMLLASRTTTIILALLVLAASGWLFFRAKRVLALGVAGMFVLALGGVLLNDMSRNIFFSTSLFRTDWGRPQDVGPYDGGLTRHFIWQAVQTVEAKMPWYGYGTGTAREVLTQEYERMQFNIAIPGKMNAHNQYFETMLDLGYPGLALLLTLLGAGLWVGYKHNRLLGVFAFIVAMLFLTESHLEAQKGAVFITFMYALIGSTPKGSPDEAEESPSA